MHHELPKKLMSQGQIISLNTEGWIIDHQEKNVIYRDLQPDLSLYFWQKGKVQRRENSKKVINFTKKDTVFHDIDFTTCSVNKEDLISISS